jgi:hypothetical protein
MHGTPLTGPQRRTAANRSTRTRAWPLENGLTRNRTTGCRPGGRSGLHRRWRRLRWCLVYRSRTSLRHDHPTLRRSGRGWLGCRGSRGRRVCRRRWGDGFGDCRGHSSRWRLRARRSDSRSRCRRYCRRSGCLWRSRRRLHWRWWPGLRNHESGCRSHRLHRGRGRRCSCGRGRRCRFFLNNRGWSARARRRCYSSRLLLRNELQDITGLGDMREVDLGLDFVTL